MELIRDNFKMLPRSSFQLLHNSASDWSILHERVKQMARWAVLKESMVATEASRKHFDRNEEQVGLSVERGHCMWYAVSENLDQHVHSRKVGKEYPYL